MKCLTPRGFHPAIWLAAAFCCLAPAGHQRGGPLPGPPAGQDDGGAARAAPDPGGDAIRSLAERLHASGELERMMLEAKIDPGSGTYVDLERVDRLRRALLERAGRSWDQAGTAAREAATAAAFEGVLQVQRRARELRGRAAALLVSRDFDLLVRRTAAGFEDLSSRNAFLDEAGMSALAVSVVRQQHPAEADAVRARLAGRLKDLLWQQAQTAKAEFRRHVRFIFFGEEGFGTRDDFLPFAGPEARRAAIETALWRVIRQHPEHGRALREPFTQSVVTEQARALAETIQNVPSPPPARRQEQ